MYQLNEWYSVYPTRSTINLEFHNIRDLTPMVGLLSKFTKLEQLLLHGNKMVHLPNLQPLRMLRKLDISNNPIKIDSYLLDNLFLITQLEVLSINTTQQEVDKITESLPRLKVLNDVLIERLEREEINTVEELARHTEKLKEEMERVYHVYNKLTSLLDDSKQPKASEEEFKHLYRDVLEQLTYCSGLTDTLSCEGVFVYCKNKLVSILDMHLQKLLEENGMEGLAKAIENINKFHTENFEQMLKTIFSISYKGYLDEVAQRPSNRLRKEKLYLEEIARLKHENSELKKENKRVQRVDRKGDQYVHKDRRKQKGKQEKDRSSEITPIHSKSRSMLEAFSVQKEQSSDSNSMKNRKLQIDWSHDMPTPPVSPIQLVPLVKKKPQTPLLPSGSANRIVSLEQLVVLAQQIMAQKSKYNRRCLDKNECFETAEQFLYTFFARKYGLKDIALEWAISLIKAIELYSKERIQVEVFGKILKNELYESYYAECHDFSKVVARTLKEFRVGSEDEVQVSKFEAIFKAVFPECGRAEVEKVMGKSVFPIRGEELAYFMEKYKLALKQTLLKPFLSIFSRIDSDEDGSLTAEQSKKLIIETITASQIDPSLKSRKQAKLFSQVDALPKNKIILSELYQIVHQHLK